MYQMRSRYHIHETNISLKMSQCQDTHDAGVAGADVRVRLHRVPDTEVVSLLLQLGQVEGPGLLSAEVHLARGHSLSQLPPPPEWAAEHGPGIFLE